MSSDNTRWGGLVALQSRFAAKGSVEKKSAATHSPALSTPDFTLLDPYVAELARWNRTIRLVGPRDEEGIAAQVADSLAPFLIVAPTFPLLDIGSGAGLPAIPLALLWGERVVCVEPRRKRVTFLNQVKRLLGLEQVETVCARAEEVLAPHPALANSFACVTARAVSDVATLLGWAEPYLAPDGVAVLGRGGGAPVEVEGWKLVSFEEYESQATGAPRSVVVYSRAQ
jgi:16S rRNA (guanine527-N7)-methyltransferase